MRLMTLSQNRLARSREGLVAVVMFAALLGAVGAAAWLVRERTIIPAQRGREILSEIRRNGLGHYWRAAAFSGYYVGRDMQGRNIGWMRVERRRFVAKFAGASFASQSTKQKTEEKWQLDDKLTSGWYEGDKFAMTGSVKTTITLEDGRVSVTQIKGSAAQSAEAALPDDYLPEGTLELAARLVAESGQRTSFEVIFNDIAIMDGKVNFTRVSMVPLSGRRARLESTMAPGRLAIIYEFDEQGEIQEQAHPEEGTRYIRTKEPAEDAQTRREDI